nr:hypothetical protein [Tanacetum cinerariifolium]
MGTSSSRFFSDLSSTSFVVICAKKIGNPFIMYFYVLVHEMMLNHVAFPWLLPSPCMIKVSFPQGMRMIFSAHAMTA